MIESGLKLIVPDLADGHLTTNDVGGSFEDFITNADTAIEEFLKSKTEGGTEEGGEEGGGEEGGGVTKEATTTPGNQSGTLNLSSADSLQLQRLMGDQSIAAQTGTSTLKAVKDNITAAARNI